MFRQDGIPFRMVKGRLGVMPGIVAEFLTVWQGGNIWDRFGCDLKWEEQLYASGEGI